MTEVYHAIVTFVAERRSSRYRLVCGRPDGNADFYSHEYVHPNPDGDADTVGDPDPDSLADTGGPLADVPL
jgi:hypothetical protein